MWQWRSQKCSASVSQWWYKPHENENKRRARIHSSLQCAGPARNTQAIYSLPLFLSYNVLVLQGLHKLYILYLYYYPTMCRFCKDYTSYIFFTFLIILQCAGSARITQVVYSFYLLYIRLHNNVKTGKFFFSLARYFASNR